MALPVQTGALLLFIVVAFTTPFYVNQETPPEQFRCLLVDYVDENDHSAGPPGEDGWPFSLGYEPTFEDFVGLSNADIFVADLTGHNDTDLPWSVTANTVYQGSTQRDRTATPNRFDLGYDVSARSPHTRFIIVDAPDLERRRFDILPNVPRFLKAASASRHAPKATPELSRGQPTTIENLSRFLEPLRSR